jgi:hypothetical protein
MHKVHACVLDSGSVCGLAPLPVIRRLRKAFENKAVEQPNPKQAFQRNFIRAMAFIWYSLSYRQEKEGDSE